MRNHLSETLMLNDMQIISDYMSRWVALKRRVGAVTSQRVLNFTANAVSVAIGDNGNRFICIESEYMYILININEV